VILVHYEIVAAFVYSFSLLEAAFVM